MAYYKEIVTKAVIGKGKKSTTLEHIVTADSNINTVLGCWVINHTFNGINQNGKIIVNGSYDVNIWYSYDDNTKTNVLIKKFNYQDNMNVRIREDGEINNSEIIVRALIQPSVNDVNVDGNNIKLSIHKEMGVEVVGDTLVKVSVEDDYDDYEEISDDVTNDEIDKIEVNEDYLN